MKQIKLLSILSFRALKVSLLILGCLIGLTILSTDITSAWAQDSSPQVTMAYQGTLFNDDGEAITGSVSLTFRLYTQSENIWKTSRPHQQPCSTCNMMGTAQELH